MLNRLSPHLVCVSLFFLFLSSFVYGEDILKDIVKRKKLLIGTDVGYAPFEMKRKDGRLIGFDIDLAKMIAKELNVKVQFVDTDWDGIMPSLLTKKFDMVLSAMTVTGERNIKINFSNPYYIAGQTILLKKSLSIQSYKDLNNKKYKIGSVIGSTGEKTIKRMFPKAIYRSYQRREEVGQDLINGRIDVFIYDKPYIESFYSMYKKNSKVAGKLIHLDTPITYEPLAIAVRRDDVNILNWLNNFLAQIKSDGRYQKMYDKWFKDNSWEKLIK